MRATGYSTETLSVPSTTSYSSAATQESIYKSFIANVKESTRTSTKLSNYLTTQDLKDKLGDPLYEDLKAVAQSSSSFLDYYEKLKRSDVVNDILISSFPCLYGSQKHNFLFIGCMFRSAYRIAKPDETGSDEEFQVALSDKSVYRFLKNRLDQYDNILSTGLGPVLLAEANRGLKITIDMRRCTLDFDATRSILFPVGEGMEFEYKADPDVCKALGIPAGPKSGLALHALMLQRIAFSLSKFANGRGAEKLASFDRRIRGPEGVVKKAFNEAVSQGKMALVLLHIIDPHPGVKWMVDKCKYQFYIDYLEAIVKYRRTERNWIGYRRRKVGPGVALTAVNKISSIEAAAKKLRREIKESDDSGPEDEVAQ